MCVCDWCAHTDAFCLLTVTVPVARSINQDEDELFKIHSFIALTKPFKQVVLPVLKGEERATEAEQRRRWDEECKEEIETWPIVQAYGLDGQLGCDYYSFFQLFQHRSCASSPG